METKMNDRVKLQRQPRRYDWHCQDQDSPMYIGIYRIINSGLRLFEEDFMQVRTSGEDQADLKLADRLEFVCELLNEGLITERQANDIGLLLTIKR